MYANWIALSLGLTGMRKATKVIVRGNRQAVMTSGPPLEGPTGTDNSISGTSWFQMGV